MTDTIKAHHDCPLLRCKPLSVLALDPSCCYGNILVQLDVTLWQVWYSTTHIHRPFHLLMDIVEVFSLIKMSSEMVREECLLTSTRTRILILRTQIPQQFCIRSQSVHNPCATRLETRGPLVLTNCKSSSRFNRRTCLMGISWRA